MQLSLFLQISCIMEFCHNRWTNGMHLDEAKALFSSQTLAFIIYRVSNSENKSHLNIRKVEVFASEKYKGYVVV